MRRILFLCMILFVFTLIMVRYYVIKPLYTEVKTIEVTIVYHQHPNLLTLEPFSKLEDALKLIETADDVDYQRLNGQTVLKHGDVITLPVLDDTHACISVNHGTLEDLMQLPGVGEATASQIMAYREQHGLFQTVEGIMEVKGIGSRKFAKMRDFLCL